MATTMAQAHGQEEFGSARTSLSTPTGSPQQKKEKRKGLRHAIRKWKDGLKSDHSPSPSRNPSTVPSRAPSNASPLSKSISASSPTSVSVQSTSGPKTNQGSGPHSRSNVPLGAVSPIPESNPAAPLPPKTKASLEANQIDSSTSPSPATQVQPTAASNPHPTTVKSTPKHIQIPPADKDRDEVLFKSTCQTTIHSPLDKRHSKSSIRRSYLGSRRFTAPADYFGSDALSGLKTKSEEAAKEQDPARPPSGNSLGRRASKLRSPFSKRASVAGLPSTSSSRPSSTLPTTREDDLDAQRDHAPSLAPLNLSQPLSPLSTLSEPSPPAYSNTHSTWAYTTASEIAALAAAHEAQLTKAAEVIQRDKPKDFYDPGWRERDERAAKEAERKMEEGRKEMGQLGAVRMKAGEHEGVLKKWEWGH